MSDDTYASGFGHITVGKLRELIKDVDDDTIVVMSRDAEGNGYAQLAQVDVEQYRYEGGSYGGDVFDTTDEYYETEEEIPPSAVPCVLLWPVN